MDKMAEHRLNLADVLDGFCRKSNNYLEEIEYLFNVIRLNRTLGLYSVCSSTCQMDEKQLSDLFYKFLEEKKGFPKNSLLKQAPGYIVGGTRVQADLLILDTRIGDYIGIVEFKPQINPQVKRMVKNHSDLYLRAIKSETIPIYLVFPTDDNSFQILVYGDEDWLSITQDEFPEFETLSAKKKIEEKKIAQEIEVENLKNFELKLENSRRTSLWTLASLVAGLSTAILTFYLTIGEERKKSEFSEDLLGELEIVKMKIGEFEDIKPLRSSVVDTVLILDSTNTYLGLEKRVSVIENGILNSPEKILVFKDLTNKVELLSEQIKNQEKLIQLRNENLVGRIEWLNAIVLGMVIALFGAAIGFVLTNYASRKENSVNK